MARTVSGPKVLVERHGPPPDLSGVLEWTGELRQIAEKRLANGDSLEAYETFIRMIEDFEKAHGVK